MSELEFVNGSKVTLYRAAASDLDVARAAWVSQDAEAHEKEKDAGRVEGLIKFLYKNQHMSPFEHGQLTFVVETPLFVAREFHRHRTMSYNEISGRYTILPNKFYIPDTEKRPLQQTGKVGAYTFELGTYAQKRAVEGALTRMAVHADEEYQGMLNIGVAKEVARMALTITQMTSFWATVNPRNLMHFLDLRTDPSALYEIREVAGIMEEHFSAAMPYTYNAWKGES